MTDSNEKFTPGDMDALLRAITGTPEAPQLTLEQRVAKLEADIRNLNEAMMLMALGNLHMSKGGERNAARLGAIEGKQQATTVRLEALERVVDQRGQREDDRMGAMEVQLQSLRGRRDDYDRSPAKVV